MPVWEVNPESPRYATWLLKGLGAIVVAWVFWVAKAKLPVRSVKVTPLAWLPWLVVHSLNPSAGVVGACPVSTHRKWSLAGSNSASTIEDAVPPHPLDKVCAD